MKDWMRIFIALLLAPLSFMGVHETAQAAPSFQQTGNTLVMSNVNVRLVYNLNSGTTDFYWENSKKISAFYSGVTLSTGYVKGINYSSWSYAVIGSNQVVVTAAGSGLPVMKQYFTLDQADSFLVRVEMVGTNLSANWMGPVVVDGTGGVDVGAYNDDRALCVPFDNDHFVSYNAMPINNSGISYEVGAFYDNTTRNGLVIGSVTHDVWKSGVYFFGANNKLNQMNVYGGAASPWDVMPHGSVAGNTISSPTMFVGFNDDWRTAMANYAAENTNFAPRLSWTNGVPFGWNSWGVIQQNINYTNAVAVSDFFHTNLQAGGFASRGTVYINLDAFWNNNFSSFQLQSFVNHCHALGQKAGIYFGPFAFFGSAGDATNWFVTGTTNAYHYSDILLRDANGNFETNDGALAVDPTHPGTRQQIDYYVNLFTNYGFDYVKADFLSHGAMEGVHYDTNVTTGIEAYNQGMQYLLNRLNGRMFISESIAPLFPYQYAHSRRIACDAQASLIGNTAYTMNSVSYGWWLDNLYQFNDPDLMVFGNGADTNEQQSRLISGAVTGVFLDGDDLTTTSGQTAAETCLGNAAINDVARGGRTFTPLEGNTGTSPANVFVRQDGATWCLAAFNYNPAPTNLTIDLARAGLPPGSYVATNLWDGSTATVTGSLNVSLNAKQAKLFRLVSRLPANLRWNAVGNNGAWDTGISSNWFNPGNGQQTVFYSGDQVLFDDTGGVSTNVTLGGTVAPGLITVDSSVNNFNFTGSGTITGTGGLVKLGSSQLSILSPANLTGPVTIGGGSVYTGDYAFAYVSVITVTNNATLDFGGGALTGNKPVTVSGAGVNGEGALFNSSYAIYNQLNITLAGDTTLGGSSRWDLGSGSTITGPCGLTVNWSDTNGYGEWDTVNLATNVGDILLATGKLGIKNMSNGFGNPGNTLTVNTNCELDFWSGGCNRNLHVRSNGKVQIFSAPDDFDANVSLDDNAQWYCYGGSGSQNLNGACVLNGIVHVLVGDANRVFTNVISGPGGFVMDAWNHQLILAASNTYAGPTVISNGSQVALAGAGSISHSALIFFGGNNPANTAMDVSGRLDQTLTLAGGQTLAGIGGINGSLTVSASAVLSPAGTNVALGITAGANATGTLAATGNITLSGTTVVKLNGSGTNDVIQAGAGITYGGTLNLANISRAPLAAGNSFQIFNAASYAGSFVNVSPATPGAGLAWDLSQLNSGKVSVVTGGTSPLINSTKMTGDNFVFSGTGGSAKGTYHVLVSTNIAAPLANWTILSTSSFDNNGNFSVTNPITNSLQQQQYYLLKFP